MLFIDLYKHSELEYRYSLAQGSRYVRSMKTTHIIGLIMVAAAIGVLFSVSGDMGTYSNFQTAMELPDQKHQIVGYLAKDKPMTYDPEIDANLFSFFMKDKKGTEKKVAYIGTKPQDFERSEELVLTGTMKGEEFVATDMLMKCPSKYTEEEIQLRDNVYSESL